VPGKCFSNSSAIHVFEKTQLTSSFFSPPPVEETKRPARSAIGGQGGFRFPFWVSDFHAGSRLIVILAELAGPFYDWGP